MYSLHGHLSNLFQRLFLLYSPQTLSIFVYCFSSVRQGNTVHENTCKVVSLILFVTPLFKESSGTTRRNSLNGHFSSLFQCLFLTLFTSYSRHFCVCCECVVRGDAHSGSAALCSGIPGVGRVLPMPASPACRKPRPPSTLGLSITVLRTGWRRWMDGSVLPAREYS